MNREDKEEKNIIKMREIMRRRGGGPSENAIIDKLNSISFWALIGGSCGIILDIALIVSFKYFHLFDNNSWKILLIAQAPILFTSICSLILGISGGKWVSTFLDWYNQ